MEPGQVLEQLAFGSRYALFEIALGHQLWLDCTVEMDLTASNRDPLGAKVNICWMLEALKTNNKI